MPVITARPVEADQELEFAWDDMNGLLNVVAVPQKVADNELTIAQNVYGRVDGGVQMRKGMKLRGSQISANPILGAFRFTQQIVNGVAQAAVNKLLVQNGTIGDRLYDYDGNTPLTAASSLGSAPNPWSAQYILDGDHTLPTPGAPTANAPSAGGSLSAGTYLASVTWLNAAGETIRGADVTISGVPGSGQFTLTQPTPPTGAVNWNAYVSTAGGNRASETLQNASPLPVATTTLVVTALGSHGSPPSSNTAIAPSDVMVICTGSGGPYIWDGTSLYTPATWTTNCASASWCIVFCNTLFFGGIPGQPNQVVGMQPGHPETLPIGAVNTFLVSHPVTGLGLVSSGGQGGLVIGMTEGFSLLWGIAGSSSFVLQELPSVEGCTAGRTMITINGMLYVLGATDIFLIDGSGVYSIGYKVRPYLRNDSLAVGQYDVPLAGTRSLSFSYYYDQKIYFWYPASIAGGAAPGSYCNAALVWDLQLRGWTTLVGPTLMAAALLNAPGDDGISAVVFDGQIGKGYNWDVYNGTGHNVDDNGTTITAVAQSKFFKLGRPGHPKKLMRVYPGLFVDTAFGGLVICSTDYGATSTVNLPSVPPTSAAIWDTSKWDQANWAAFALTYIIQRLDPSTAITPAGGQTATFALSGEAFAFQIFTADTNPPWIWQEIANALFVLEPAA